MKIIKRILWFVVPLLVLFAFAFWYVTDTSRVDDRTLEYYQQLKTQLKEKGYTSKVFIISAKRPQWYNNLLVRLKSGATQNSRHLNGEALDIIVLDINKDGKRDTTDVNIVYAILDKEIVKDAGGLGTYKSFKGFFSRQMVHFDCRGKRARWNK